ncbi:RNA methyltransferase [Puteibacter caeruleilacunae]|nr:RNA methyltransferase [Puteibacter caeruleilacunae]
MTLSKKQISLIKSLDKKKFRNKENLFIAEGYKCVHDLIEGGIAVREIFATQPTHDKLKSAFPQLQVNCIEEFELKKISHLKTPQNVLGIFKIPTHKISTSSLAKQLTLCLDGIQDPGNLGTIIRLADWFGIRHIICSPDTADTFNPKVIQATMGAIARVKLTYQPLEEFFNINEVKALPVYGTFLDGDNLYEQEVSSNGIIVMGNEGKGISANVENFVNKRLYIPSFPANIPTSESLNVAIATSIICAEFRRRASS